MEERLEQVFSQMKGVGKVKVMVTLKDNGENCGGKKDVASSGDTVNSTDKEAKCYRRDKKWETVRNFIHLRKMRKGSLLVSRQSGTGD
ncbi:MAG: hypothetical protein V8R80_12130 [Eubacterium sp.]